jgi:hypothetical protein
VPDEKPSHTRKSQVKLFWTLGTAAVTLGLILYGAFNLQHGRLPKWDFWSLNVILLALLALLANDIGKRRSRDIPHRPPPPPPRHRGNEHGDRTSNRQNPTLRESRALRRPGPRH